MLLILRIHGTNFFSLITCAVFLLIALYTKRLLVRIQYNRAGTWQMYILLILNVFCLFTQNKILGLKHTFTSGPAFTSSWLVLIACTAYSKTVSITRILQKSFKKIKTIPVSLRASQKLSLPDIIFPQESRLFHLHQA